jgi:hypothetical protein
LFFDASMLTSVDAPHVNLSQPPSDAFVCD